MDPIIKMNIQSLLEITGISVDSIIWNNDSEKRIYELALDKLDSLYPELNIKEYIAVDPFPYYYIKDQYNEDDVVSTVKEATKNNNSSLVKWFIRELENS